LFSKSLAKHLKFLLIDDLVYKKNMEIGKIQGLNRLKELDEAFAIRQIGRYHPKYWLLLDDVITTGGAIVSCGKTILKVYGVSHCIV
tara:strand:- start:14016 stop:14276 length:261 start_codon:yes stop_codon:yes gene_type:complete